MLDCAKSARVKNGFGRREWLTRKFKLGGAGGKPPRWHSALSSLRCNLCHGVRGTAGPLQRSHCLSRSLSHYAPARRSAFTPVMSRGTWVRLLDLQKTRNVFTDGARHLVEHASLRAEAAEAAVVEFCEDYSKLEAHFKRVPREGGASGGGSPVAAALPAQLSMPAATLYVWFNSNQALSMYFHSYSTFEKAWEAVANAVSYQNDTWGANIEMTTETAEQCQQQPEVGPAAHNDTWVVATYTDKGRQHAVRIMALRL